MLKTLLFKISRVYLKVLITGNILSVIATVITTFFFPTSNLVYLNTISFFFVLAVYTGPIALALYWITKPKNQEADTADIRKSYNFWASTCFVSGLFMLGAFLLTFFSAYNRYSRLGWL